MRQAEAVDGFTLAYDRAGAGPPVVLLHGWPGDRTDYADVVPLVSAAADVIVPDLRGFGESGWRDPAGPAQYAASAQAASVAALITELGLTRPVVAGYDIGSRIAQALAREYPGLVSALVIAPPLPGIGQRILEPAAQKEFWYQSFHQLDLCPELIDGQPQAVRSYLRHFWSHWSGPDFEPAAERIEHLTARYGAPGAFTASISWYRAGAGSVALSVAEREPEPAGRLALPVTVLWPEHDPLFPPDWSDRVDAWFADATVTHLPGSGHFVPAEAPADFAAAVIAASCQAG